MERDLVRGKDAAVIFNLTDQIPQCNDSTCRPMFQITTNAINGNLAVYRDCRSNQNNEKEQEIDYWKPCYGKTQVTSNPFTLEIPASP